MDPVDERLPEVGTKCWYYFDIVGSPRGLTWRIHEDEEGKFIWYEYSIVIMDF